MHSYALISGTAQPCENQDGSYRFGFLGGVNWTSQDGSESFLFGVRFREGEAPAEPPGLRIPGLYRTYTNSLVAHHRDKGKALSDSRLGRSLALPTPYRCAGACRKSSHSYALISGTAQRAEESKR